MNDAQQFFDRFSPRTAWQPYYPLGTNPWDLRKVAHLHRRAGFGASWSELQAGVAGSPSTVIAALLKGGPGQRPFEDDYEKLREEAVNSGDPKRYQALWFYRLIHSPHPLQERMTVFWHNHFATSNAKVASLPAMQRQQDIFRKHALGHFGEMLQEMTRDPAMIVWLDSNTNKKGKPNENYAREVFELFSLGVGNYTEKDIQEAARALTGWEVRDGRAVFHPAEFDAGEKTILGRTGHWTAGDVVRIALEQPTCARFLVRKLFRELVSETVELSDRMIAPLADEFRLRNYDIAWLVETMLRSWVFFSPASIHQRVKSPVEFLIGASRMLEGRIGPAQLTTVCESLGQSLFYPPSVKGWDGGSDWINSTTLLRRQNFLYELTRGQKSGLRSDPAGLLRQYHIVGDGKAVAWFLQLLLQEPEHEALPRIVAHLQHERQRLRSQFFTRQLIDEQAAREAAHLVATLPEFQIS